MIILDYGCKYKGFCSDISRIVFIGEPTEEQRKVYDIVLKANKEAEKAVREGVKAEEVDELIKLRGYLRMDNPTKIAFLVFKYP